MVNRAGLLADPPLNRYPLNLLQKASGTGRGLTLIGAPGGI